jgi:hypothetical protein
MAIASHAWAGKTQPSSRRPRAGRTTGYGSAVPPARPHGSGSVLRKRRSSSCVPGPPSARSSGPFLVLRVRLSKPAEQVSRELLRVGAREWGRDQRAIRAVQQIAPGSCALEIEPCIAELEEPHRVLRLAVHCGLRFDIALKGRRLTVPPWSHNGKMIRPVAGTHAAPLVQRGSMQRDSSRDFLRGRFTCRDQHGKGPDRAEPMTQPCRRPKRRTPLGSGSPLYDSSGRRGSNPY